MRVSTSCSERRLAMLCAPECFAAGYSGSAVPVSGSHGCRVDFSFKKNLPSSKTRNGYTNCGTALMGAMQLTCGGLLGLAGDFG